MAKTRFDWDPDKNAENQGKHGVSFSRAQYAFAEPQRVIAKDETHSQTEERFYCFGAVDGGVLTVRFTYRTSVHLPHFGYSNHRRRLLAQRKDDL